VLISDTKGVKRAKMEKEREKEIECLFYLIMIL
jgi:hypothetical protein